MAAVCRALFCIAAFLIVLLALAAGPAAASAAAGVQDLKNLSLEELMNLEVQTVYAASKHEQHVSDAPSSVTIITCSDIKKYGYRTLADILRSVRSFYITNDRNYTYLGVRGFGRPGDYNSRILLLVDGHRTNDNVYDQAFIGTEGIIDVDLIDRIEVIRGPGSSLYGNNAFFAVVNVITRKGRDVGGLEASGSAGSFGSRSGRLTWGSRSADGTDILLSGSGLTSDGQQLFYPEYASPATNYGITDHTDYDRAQNFFGKTSFRDVTLEAAYNSRTKGIPTGSFGTDFNNPANRTTDGHAYADARYDRDFGGKSQITARLYYDYYWYDGYYAYFTDPAVQALNRDVGIGSWWGAELKYSTRLYKNHHVTVGGEYIDNIQQEQQNYNVNPPAIYLDDSRSSKIWAAYVQDEFSVAPNLIVNAGIRYDHYETFGETLNPRVAFIYKPTDRNAVKFLYGSAFRAPNIYELYYVSPTSAPPMIANPLLKPEKIKTYELVYEHSLRNRLRVTAAAYVYHINNLINETTEGGNSVFDNIDEVRARGVEAELANTWANGVDARFSYTLQRTEDSMTGQPLTNSPAQLAKLNVSVPLVHDKLMAGLDEQYVSRRTTRTGAETGGYDLTNITLFSSGIIRNLEVSASVYNLFNRRFADPVSDEHRQDVIVQDGRTYRIKLTYFFF